MFRIPEATALINRMGFNNKGVDHLVAQVARSRYRGIRGISIGKNFDTPLENAQDDYVTCLRKVYSVADYVAVNVSSPNTARLRELQGGDGLERILGALHEERRVLQERFGKRVPLLVKIAPDLTPEQIFQLARDLRSLDVDGLIATNTSTGRDGLPSSPAAGEQGGLSGAPLHPLSVGVIAQLRAELGSGFPLIGVGGIVSADNARATLRAGANLIQIYTGFAYRGPMLLDDIIKALST
jgi:dihydroorotate dehydrogenase